MPSTPAGPYAPSAPTLGGVLDHAAVHQDIADDITTLSTGAASETSQRIAGDSARQVTSEKAQPNGYASLDTNGMVPAAQLPAPAGAAGGALAGAYPNPTIAAGAVGPNELGALAVGTTKINTNAVTNNKLAAVGANVVKGAVAAGNVTDLTGTQVTSILDLYTAAVKGIVPPSGGGVTNFLRADGTWNVPASAGGPPTGAAGGSLAGSYPNPTLAPTAVVDLNVFTYSLQGVVPPSVSSTRVLTGSGWGFVSGASIYNNTVVNSSLVDVSAGTLKGRQLGSGTGSPQDLTGTDATALLDPFTSALKGLAPSSGGGTTNFLRADGLWATPPGGGGATLTPTSTKTGDYIAVVNDDVLCDITSTAFTVTLPASPADGALVRVRLVAATTSGLRVLTIAPGAGATMDATTSGTPMIYAGQWTLYQYQASTTSWRHTEGFGPGYMPVNRLAIANGNLNMNSNRVVSVADATAATDALNRQFGDGRYLQSLAGLNAALLAVKVWSGSAYVWPGTGTAPDASSYTNIIFIDPTGLHDPATSTGGRSNPNDLWETGTGGGGGGTSLGTIIAVTRHNPAAYTSTITTSSTFADVDTTNLAVTFTAPSTGNVLVELSAGSFLASGCKMQWNLREASSNVTGTTQTLGFMGSAATANYTEHTKHYVSGLTASSSHTYKWGHARLAGSGNVATVYGQASDLAEGYQAMMIVHSMP